MIPVHYVARNARGPGTKNKIAPDRSGAFRVSAYSAYFFGGMKLWICFTA